MATDRTTALTPYSHDGYCQLCERLDDDTVAALLHAHIRAFAADGNRALLRRLTDAMRVTSAIHPCPECGEGYLQRRPGKKKNTFWWGCDNYPKCNHTSPDNDGKPGVWSERAPAATGGTQAGTGSVGADSRPASGSKKGSASGGKAAPGKRKAIDKTYPCTACGKGWLQKRSGSRGAFWGCSNYPDCKHCENDVHGVPQNHVKKTS